MATDAGNSRRGRLARGTLTRLAVSAAAALFAVGCGTTQSASHSHDPHGVTVVRVSATGSTVHIAVGDRLELIWSSDYWQVHGSSSNAVLARYGRPHYLPRPKSCPNIPGLGCVPFETTFKALSKGTAVITASRQACGEALRCRPSQRHVMLTVVVR